MRGLRDLCDENDWLLIADEVLTGLGRTGKMWGIEHSYVIPELLVVGKNLSGGIEPCAGVATRDEVLGDNPQSGTGSTFAATPAGCAAGLKTLEIYERDGVVAHAAMLGEIAAPILKSWEKYPIVKQVRGVGLLLGVSFGDPSGGEDSRDSGCASRRSRSSPWSRSGILGPTLTAIPFMTEEQLKQMIQQLP